MERISQKELPNGLYQAMSGVKQHIKGSGLDPLLIELIDTYVSQLNGCAFCLDMHMKEAMRLGESTQRLISLPVWRETNYYSKKEQAVLAFAERLTNIQQEKQSEDIHDELSAHFSKAEIANLTIAIAQINSWNRLVKSFGWVAGTYQSGK